MPPKKNTGAKRKHGQLSLTLSKEEQAKRTAKVKAEWEEKRQKKVAADQASEEEEQSEEEEEQQQKAAKRQKTSPKKGGRRKSAPAPSAASTTRGRRKEPPAPPAAATPPRSAAKKNKAGARDSVGLFSPKPGSAAKSPREDEEEDTIPPPPPSFPASSRPAASPKKDDADPEEVEDIQGAKKTANPETEEYSDDYSDDDDYDDESHSSTENDNMGNVALMEGELHALNSRADQDPAPVHASPKPSLFSRFMRGIFITIVLGGAFLSILPESLRDMVWTPPPSPTICFYDSPHQQEEQKVKMADMCRNEEEKVVWKECPSASYCRGGKLLSCPDGFDVAPYGCVLTAGSNETIDAMMGILQEWTAKDTCKGHPERYEEYGLGHRPLFHYSRVTGELELGYNPGLIKHANHSRFLLKHANKGDLWIGLHPDVHVRLTYVCYFKLMLYGFLGVAWEVLFLCSTYLWFVVKMYFDSFYEEPVAVGGTSICAVIAISMYWRQVKEANARRLLAKDMTVCHELAIGFLSADPNKIWETGQLSKKIQWNRYQMSRMGRRRVDRVVMPRLEEEFRTDQRIRCIRRLNKGKPVDTWQWVGPPEGTHARTVQFAG